MAELTIERAIDAPRSLLWRYVSTALGLSCWQADEVEGSLEEGSFSLRWPELGARLDLSVAELVHGERLVLRAGENALSMHILDSKFVLQHAGLQEDDDLVGLASSWHAALSLLQIAATAHPRIPRTVRWLFQPIVASAELAHHFFTDARGLASWLGEPDRALLEPGPFSLTCDGLTLRGNVLFGERDVCLQVEQLGHGALTFRTLPSPRDQRIVALGVSSWKGDPDEKLLALLEGALVRLARLTEAAHG